MNDTFSRTALLLGENAIKKLNAARVAIFGIGGVGSYVAEALARSGVGNFTLIDGDVVSKSNINRQIIALNSTIGKSKSEVMKERIYDINPNAKVCAINEFYGPDNADLIDFSEFSYIVDAVDTVTSKLLIIEKAKKAGVPIISSMGAGNKLDATKFTVCDIYKTSVCPLARVMRRELKSRGIDSLKVVYSPEKPIDVSYDESFADIRKKPPGSLAFVPSVCGLIIAGEVIKDLIK